MRLRYSPIITFSIGLFATKTLLRLYAVTFALCAITEIFIYSIYNYYIL
jgi:hypothetical protein